MTHADRDMQKVIRLVHCGCGVLVVLVTAGVVGLLVYPAYRKVQQTEHATAELQHDLAVITEVHASRSEINEEMGLYRQRLEEFEKQLPSSARMDEFLKGFSGVAAGCRVQIDDIHPKSLSAGPMYYRKPILVSARARFLDYFRFLMRLQEYARITRIKRLDVTAEPHHDLCTFEMTLLIYASGPGRSVTDASG
jgi:Tfp pilus assembly protein PilO